MAGVRLGPDGARATRTGADPPSMNTRANAIGHPAPKPDLTGLADRVRRLATQNDPNVIRAGLAEIADALDTAVFPVT